MTLVRSPFRGPKGPTVRVFAFEGNERFVCPVGAGR
jgi:hypothetical protein